MTPEQIEAFREEAREARKFIEVKLAQALHQFTAETGFTVSEISLDRTEITQLGESHATYVYVTRVVLDPI